MTELLYELTITKTVRGDSVFTAVHVADTLLALSENDKLRKFKGYYFLNHNKGGSSIWRVKRMAVTRYGVTLASISSKEDISQLRAIENSPDTNFVFNPTRKQMKEFLKAGGFREEEVFVKVGNRK